MIVHAEEVSFLLNIAFNNFIREGKFSMVFLSENPFEKLLSQYEHNCTFACNEKVFLMDNPLFKLYNEQKQEALKVKDFVRAANIRDEMTEMCLRFNRQDCEKNFFMPSGKNEVTYYLHFAKSHVVNKWLHATFAHQPIIW
jgi:hypothetical protein